jgi:hypothetical protein
MNEVDQFGDDFLVVDPTIKEILDLMLGENSKACGDKIQLYAKRLFSNNSRGQVLASKLLNDIRTGASSLTSVERLELLELLVGAHGY